MAAGMFGKVPSFGDFVSLGSGSRLHRSFERWLEASNDVLAARGLELPKHPLGLLIRDEEPGVLLVGIVVGSSDSVGRSFPLGLYFELAWGERDLAALPLAMGPSLERLAGVARGARTRGHREVQELVLGLERPGDELVVRSRAQRHRLQLVEARTLLERVHGDAYYGCEVIGRACSLAAERASHRPLILEGRARTDLELMFMLASIEAMSGGRQPGAVLWDVRHQRVLFVLGTPDDALLALMAEGADAERLWPLWTEQAVIARRAREELPAARRTLLDEAGSSSAMDFLAETASACTPTQTQAAANKQRRRTWRSKAQ